MYSRKDLRKSAVSAAVLLALGIGNAYGSTSINNNFTMLGGTGGITGGNNDTVFTWDGTFKNAVVTDGTSNASLSSVTPFFGKIWTAHHINVYGPGTYVFDTTCPVGNPSCGSGTNDQKYALTVPTGYVGAHMLFDWSTSSNIDVVQLWKTDDSWLATGGDPVGSTTSPDPFSLQTPNANNNSASTVWSYVSIDTPASTIGYPVAKSGTEPTESNLYHGTKMIDGPFVGQSANFNVNVATGAVASEGASNTVSINASEPGKMPTGGCSISTQSAKPENRADWWLVAGFVVWLGMIVRRRRHSQT